MNLQEAFQHKLEFVGAKGLIFFGKDQIVIYQRDNKTDFCPYYWDLPGGGRRGGETPFQTFKREAFEEFGITLAAGDITYVKRYPSVKDPRKYGYFLVAKLPTEQVKEVIFGSEGQRYEIKDVREFLKRYKIIPQHKQRIEDYLKAV